jgi:outer membrane protein assembly factor BamD
MVWSRRVALAALVLLAPALGGCESLSGMTGGVTDGVMGLFRQNEQQLPDEPADKLYNEGLYLLNERKDIKKAAKRFEEVDRQHPYSDWARKSQLMSAYAYYQAGAYEESMAALDEVIRKYPNSEYAVSAKRKIEMAKDQLAGREMMVGRYYMERRDYAGAINRFKIVVTRYQTTRHVEEALLRLTEGYLSLGIVGEAQTSAAVLGHNFPESRWYKDAYALLGQRGLQPSENRGSWISQAFRRVGLGFAAER